MIKDSTKLESSPQGPETGPVNAYGSHFIASIFFIYYCECLGVCVFNDKTN